MSRIGKKPITIPAGEEVKTVGSTVTVKGPLGKLEWPMVQGLDVAIKDGQVLVGRSSEYRTVSAWHGPTRAELSNMSQGVTKG